MVKTSNKKISKVKRTTKKADMTETAVPALPIKADTAPKEELSTEISSIRLLNMIVDMSGNKNTSHITASHLTQLHLEGAFVRIIGTKGSMLVPTSNISFILLK